MSTTAAQLQEEIEEIILCIVDCQEHGHTNSTPVYERILARLEALLAEQSEGLSAKALEGSK